MRGLVTAIRTQQRLEVDYVSLSNPNRQGRIIVPHTFVSTGLRWHLRAWCEKSQSYRDFVLSRFRGEPELLGDRKSTRLNSSHVAISYAVFCLKKKKQTTTRRGRPV